ncbi:Protein-L-isoaspartate O-methyltransferase [Rhodovastum atsumiense]|uniref:Protein-L-isoaspartate O-methyltransferase n=1 Tax=Rhodovastum atsumiense TaxID=504468 RepID=A0A5M6ILE7_9PROT|nr:protein-L-isoaspartate O-methyltransferase [Rhodovastum atsumiense]KAA5608689.1 protein-L-isoaspartate O-methyltransferase [Rhodovastum atsumiense]CAH2599102.1 Protein-L-isoaspartate O-methyltransferase [Rhodovastum atsumiense]
MNRHVIDTADARNLMVDGQLRPNKVTDPRVIGAMRSLPRERFLPPALAPLAYVDEDVRLANGRCLMEPMVLARLVQLADPQPDERVLVVGAGSGYGAAVIAATGARVVALEEDEDLLRLARGVLPALAPQVQIAVGPLAAGWRVGAPYDLIVIEGGFEQLPPAIPEQLRQDGGRLVGVRVVAGRVGQAVIGERGGHEPAVTSRPVFDCATPILPPMRYVPGFIF